MKYALNVFLTFLLILSLYTASSLTTLGYAERIPLETIVAVVNDDVITRSELDTRLRVVKEQLHQQQEPVPPDAVLERQVLDRMVLATLQVQLADQDGIRVDDETLQRTLNRIADENGVSLTEFRSVLERDGYDFASFREDIRRQIVISRLQQHQIGDKVSVTEQEIDAFLAKQRLQDSDNKEYRLAHILIAVPDAASPERIQSARDRAEGILKRLRAGADFQQTAIATSDGQQALQGGDLGWRKLSEVPTLFADLVKTMHPGEISSLIRSPSGFHIVKLMEERNSTQHIVTQTHARHILLHTSDLMDDQAAKVKLLEIKSRIEKGADFGQLAREYSEDTVTATNGGDLGWVSPGDLVPAFEQVMNGVSEGQISEPFKTGFGWHIVQVEARRRHDDTETYQRNQARETLRNRKIEEDTQAWLTRLRDDAYVEIRLPPLPSSSLPDGSRGHAAGRQPG